MHPNLQGSNDPEVEGCYSLEELGMHVVRPESSVSTYAMMDAADVVVTFISTVGIEAAFAGKPAVMLGNTYYRNLGSVHTPESHAETIELLLSELQPLPPEGALMYGHYRLTFDERNRYVTMEDASTASFKGTTLRPSATAQRIKMLIRSRLLGGATGRFSRWHRRILCAGGNPFSLFG
jgi:hypothetical protein